MREDAIFAHSHIRTFAHASPSSSLLDNKHPRQGREPSLDHDCLVTKRRRISEALRSTHLSTAGLVCAWEQKASKWPATASQREGERGSVDLLWVAPVPFISRVSRGAGCRLQAAGLSQPTTTNGQRQDLSYSWEAGRRQSILGSGRDKVRVRFGPPSEVLKVPLRGSRGGPPRPS